MRDISRQAMRSLRVEARSSEDDPEQAAVADDDATRWQDRPFPNRYDDEAEGTAAETLKG